MIKIFKSQIRQGKILVNNDISIPDKTVVFVSYKDDSTDDFFLNASERPLDEIWNNREDDIYEQLLKK